MTNEDAIEIIETFRLIFDSPEVENKEVLLGAIDKAIKALKNERSKGEWKEWVDERWGGTTIYCPYCHEDALENNKEGSYRQVKSNFCPKCGADMREADNE